MEKYVDEDLPLIEAEYARLKNNKAAYDDAKNQLRQCKPEKIDEVNETLKAHKEAFEKQANYVSELLGKLPDHMETQRKALRYYVLLHRAHCDTSSQALYKMLMETREADDSQSTSTTSKTK